MELNLRLVTQPRPWPGNGARVVVLIIIVVAVLAVTRAGYGPATAIPAVLGAVLAAARVAGILLEDAMPRLPGPGPRTALAEPLR